MPFAYRYPTNNYIAVTRQDSIHACWISLGNWPFRACSAHAVQSGLGLCRLCCSIILGKIGASKHRIMWEKQVRFCGKINIVIVKFV